LLEIEAVRRHFGGIAAVDGVSFSVAAGMATGLIGPNGAGKTTLFNLLSGVDRPDRGEIRFEGRRISGMGAHQVARLGVGRTFQSVRIFADMSVRENLAIADLNAAHGGSAGAAGRIAEALACVDMARHIEAQAGLLSYGQRKLVELAMVLVQKPKLILLDEPVAGVNPVLTETIGSILGGLVSRGQTLLIVEHNIPFVTVLCQRVIVMTNGQLLADGSGEEIRQDERVLEAFLGG
jgi:ABC-type branched-subunit amino acid transport system ATPase component